jgi:hypothetical protein
MPITAEQRLQVARWARAGELPAGARGQLEVMRRWHDPAPADRAAIDRVLGYAPALTSLPPQPLPAGGIGLAEAGRRFPQHTGQVTADDSAAFWARVGEADATRERRAWMEQQCPGSTAGLPEPPDPAA